MNVFWAVLWKDLLTEWRSRDRLVAMGVFALVVVVILYLSAPPGMGEASRTHVPGMFWVAAVFASVLGLNRAFALELENEALAGLAMAPADRGFVLLAKAAASFVLLAAVLAGTAFVFALGFGIDLVPVLGRFAAVVGLGAAGLSVLGTLFGAMAVRTTYREVMLPLLMLPLMVPVLLGAVRATEALLAGQPVPGDALRLLVVTDAVYLIVSFIGFEFVLDD